MRTGSVTALLFFGMTWFLTSCTFGLPAWPLPWQAAPTGEPARATDSAEDTRPIISVLAPAGDDEETNRFQTLIDQFQQANPDVRIVSTLAPDYDTALTGALAASSPPDLIVLDGPRVHELAQAGALKPLAPAGASVADIDPTFRPLFLLDDVLYCAPREVRTLALVYNRSLFDSAGIAYPTGDWTWDELRFAAEALTNSETGTVGMALPPDFSRWLPFLYQAGGSVTDDAMTVMTINSNEAHTAMTFYVMLVVDGFAAAPADLESIWGGEALAQGRAAMAIEGNWVAPFLKRNYPELNIGFAELPRGPRGRATLAFTTCYAVPATAPNSAAAQRLVEFLVSPAASSSLTEEGHAMPVRLSLQVGWLQLHPEQRPFLNGLVYAQPWRFGPRFTPLFNTVNTGLQQAFLGVRSVADILAEADGVGNRALAP